MTGYEFKTNVTPRYVWGCNKCRFKGQVHIWCDDRTITVHDVYDSCSGNGSKILIVHSDEDGDYESSVGFDSLLAHYIAHTRGI